MTSSLRIALGAAVIAAATTAACGGGGTSPTTPTPPPVAAPPVAAPPATPPAGGGPNPSTATMTILASGSISPATVTIAPGGRVTIINQHNQPHDIASDPHPEHTLCLEVNEIGFLSPGQSRTSSNLNTARTCTFHDHNLPENTNYHGRIIIQ